MNKKKSNKQLKNFLIMIIIIVIILFGTIYVTNYLNQKKNDDIKYNNFDFNYDNTQNIWVVRVEIENRPYDIPFYNHPKDLQDITVETNIEDIILKNKPSKIIISIPPNSSSEMAIAGIEISKITGERYQVLKIPTTSAFNEPVKDMPYATCSSANQKTVVINFEQSNKNIISSEGNCIILEFKDGDATRVADTLSYHLLKIM